MDKDCRNLKPQILVASQHQISTWLRRNGLTSHSVHTPAASHNVTRSSAIAVKPPDALYYNFLRCAVKCCPLVNDCDLLAGFSNFYSPLFHATTSIFSSYRVHIWYGKSRVAGLQSGESRMMIDSVVWLQHINLPDRQTATSL